MRTILFLLLGFLTACPDPNASSSGTEVNNGNSGNTTQGSSNGVQETDPSAARLSCAEGDENCITISGKMKYDGTPAGTIRIDVQKIREGSAPMLVHTLELQATDEFSFDAPKGYGKIIITGFIDEAGDGPSPKDPQGRATIEILKEDITTLEIAVKADNAPVQPKPPGDIPQEQQKDGGQKEGGQTPPKDDGEKKDPPKEAPKGPPADE